MKALRKRILALNLALLLLLSLVLPASAADTNDYCTLTYPWRRRHNSRRQGFHHHPA